MKPPTIPLPGIVGALAYRRDPPGFLRRWSRRLGPVMTMQLAGVKMTVVADPDVAEAVLRSPELEARSAQARFGFDRTLGPVALHRGPDLHHQLLADERGRWAGSLDLEGSVERALDAVETRSLFGLTRRVALRVVVEQLVSPGLLDDDLLERFMVFQDRLEDATARGAALPARVADPLVYRPMARRARSLRADIAGRLGSSPWAPYLRALSEALDSSIDDLAEVVLGLLFAAHKNPGIAAAQTLAFLLTHPVASREHGPAVDRAVRETLRLTALTIGSLREVRVSTGLGGFALPAGRLVGVSHQLLATDERWAEPFRFRPERFERSPPRFLWIPFGAGPHGCPGRSLGLRLTRAMVHGLLRRSPQLQGALPPLDFTRATLAQRSRDVPIALSSPPHP